MISNLLLKTNFQNSKLRKTLENQEGCIVARMSGSGSVCYALFRRQLLVKKAHAKLKKIFSRLLVLSQKLFKYENL